ncbi:hypothetical protein D9M73_141040 [compost metagenome]
MRGEASGAAIGIIGVMREVDADADNHRIARTFQQDAGQLRTIEEEVVGPFDDRTSSAKAGEVREIDPDHLFQRHRSHQRQRGSSQIATAHPDQRRPVEIADRGNPRPPLPPAPAKLPLGAQPQPLAHPGASKLQHIGVGRARLGDGADRTRQNSALAAVLVHTPSAPSVSHPTGETNNAASVTSRLSTGVARPLYASPGASKYITLTTRR